MAGINRALHEHRDIAKFNASVDRPCIFLSHISVDKPAVKAIGEYITRRGDIDIYLDDKDLELQQAAAAGNAVGVTEFIERGLSNSTHVMCLVSASTVKSWWVPYELGFGKRSGKPLATLKLIDVKDLPAYLEISEIIKGVDSLNRYLTSVKRGLKKTMTAGALTESLLPGYTIDHPLESYVHWNA